MIKWAAAPLVDVAPSPADARYPPQPAGVSPYFDVRDWEALAVYFTTGPSSSAPNQLLTVQWGIGEHVDPGTGLITADVALPSYFMHARYNVPVVGVGTSWAFLRVQAPVVRFSTALGGGATSRLMIIPVNDAPKVDPPFVLQPDAGTAVGAGATVLQELSPYHGRAHLWAASSVAMTLSIWNYDHLLAARTTDNFAVGVAPSRADTWLVPGLNYARIFSATAGTMFYGITATPER